MNLFTARLTGKMLSTEQYEKTISEMQERVKRWRQIEQSPELAEYKKLKEQVESPEFQEKRKKLAETKYKDTNEGKKTALYQKLSGNIRMKGYKHALENETVKAFIAFRETEDFSKINDSKERRKSSELRMYNLIYRSQYYKNYLRVLNSPELEQLTELEEEMATDDFKQRNAFWQDEKRWEKTDEYKIEKRYQELAGNPDIKFYFKQRAEKIDWAELFRPAFSDDMSSSKNWKPGFGYSNPAMKDGHTYTSQLQAYNGGKNTLFADGRMDIETRHENKTTAAWDEKKGFVDKMFEYTSDAMNTKEAFAQEEGLFMAKVRSQGMGHHFFGLSSGIVNNPLVELYYYNGGKHQVGLADGQKSHTVELTGVLRSMYHIYSLRWTKKELIWYVNNMEVLRVPNTLPKEKMFMLAQSFLPCNEKGGEGKLKVQWVRIYKSVEE